MKHVLSNAIKIILMNVNINVFIVQESGTTSLYLSRSFCLAFGIVDTEEIVM